MKAKVVIVTFIALLCIWSSAFAVVNARLVLVSHDANGLVLNLEAMSDAGEVNVSLFRGGFKISETLDDRVMDVQFASLRFPFNAYLANLQYTSNFPFHPKVSYLYDYAEEKNRPFASIGADWTPVLRVTIVYNQDAARAFVDWAGSPTFMVLDEFGNDITGSLGDIPAELQDFPLPVEISSFSARYNVQKGVELRWRTESEVNNLGFNVWRSTSENGPFATKVNNEMIPGQGNSAMPVDYLFTDRNVDNNTDYWYAVEDIAFDGKRASFGPVKVNVQTGVENDAASVPLAFKLYPNHPNPFNPSTTLRYDLSTAGHVSLSIYNIRGEKIVDLVNANQAAGTYQIQWNGTDGNGQAVNSGIYYYQLLMDNRVDIQKMTFLK